MANEQKFRLNLYYRLNVFPIRVSSLRERPEDIPVLAGHFVNQFSRRMNKSIDTIPSETMAALVRCPWPGNVRELQNVIERAVVVSIGPVPKLAIEELHLRVELEEEMRTHTQPRPVINCSDGNLRATLKDAERQEIVAAIEKTTGKLAGPNGAAALLGMSRSILQFRMQKVGIRMSRAVPHR
jgi:formate hydrogenlyase transcriptional activator